MDNVSLHQARISFVCILSFAMTTKLTLLLPAHLCAESVIDSRELAEAHAMQQGFLANYESFEYYSCQYKLRFGQASSIQEAIARGPTRKILEAKLTMLRDGEHKLSRQEAGDMTNAPQYPPEKMPDGRWRGSGVVLVHAGLSSGKYSMSNFGLGATVYPGYDPREGAFEVESTTWNSGGLFIGGDKGTFGNEVQVAIDNSNNMTMLQVEPSAEIESQATTKVSFAWPRNNITESAAGANRSIYFVDEQRGFIPVLRQSIANGKPFGDAYVTDIKSCSNGRWFPMRCVVVLHWKSPGSDDVGVTEITVTNLEVDKRPSKQEFRLNLSPGVQVNDGTTAGANFSLSKNTVVSLDDLESLYQRTQTSRFQRGQGKTEQKLKGWQIWLAIATVVVGLGATAYYVRNRRRSAHAA